MSRTCTWRLKPRSGSEPPLPESYSHLSTNSLSLTNDSLTTHHMPGAAWGTASAHVILTGSTQRGAMVGAEPRGASIGPCRARSAEKDEPGCSLLKGGRGPHPRFQSSPLATCPHLRRWLLPQEAREHRWYAVPISSLAGQAPAQPGIVLGR